VTARQRQGDARKELALAKTKIDNNIAHNNIGAGYIFWAQTTKTAKEETSRKISQRDSARPGAEMYFFKNKVIHIFHELVLWSTQ
jgi:hypothetical protein